MTDEFTDIQTKLHVLKQQFYTDLPARLEQITAAGHNWLNASTPTANSDFQRLVHNLAGTAGSYGFHEVTTLCKKIEDALRTNDSNSEKSIQQWMNQLLALIKK